jgi:hypothetical protein
MGRRSSLLLSVFQTAACPRPKRSYSFQRAGLTGAFRSSVRIDEALRRELRTAGKKPDDVQTTSVEGAMLKERVFGNRNAPFE